MALTFSNVYHKNIHQNLIPLTKHRLSTIDIPENVYKNCNYLTTFKISSNYKISISPNETDFAISTTSPILLCKAFFNKILRQAFKVIKSLSHLKLRSTKSFSYVITNFRFFKGLSLLNCVPCVLKTCPRAKVPCVLTPSSANVPCVLTSSQPTCLACSRAYVFTC